MNNITVQGIQDELKIIDPQERQLIKDNISKALSNDDLISILGYQFKDDVILYSDLDNYESIEDLLPEDKTFKIILVRDTEYSGHYVAILRYSNTIEWFDSFALQPGEELNYTGSSINNELDQTKGEINDLLYDGKRRGYKIVYNKINFQEYSTDTKTIATCGRYCLLRIIMMMKYNYDLNKFIIFMKNLKLRYRLNYDQMVSLIIK